MHIKQYEEKFKEDIIELILHIQQKEFGVPVTLQDQPDLQQIPSFYIKEKGNFWVAVDDDDQVIGTLALIDIGNEQGCIRKMFVKQAYRGKEQGVAQALIVNLFNWCKQNNIQELYLGTVEILKASHRFYEKNGFERISPDTLPASFPRMPVDTVFYKCSL
jgi:N-acetylglutamate synthase-like GNAT family acetyltransferase